MGFVCEGEGGGRRVVCAEERGKGGRDGCIV